MKKLKLSVETGQVHWFETLDQARAIITAWRGDYNEVRPHSSCGRIPPAQNAKDGLDVDAPVRLSERQTYPTDGRVT